MPGVVEDLLGDQRAGEDERQGQAEQRDDRHERVAQHVPEHDALRSTRPFARAVRT